jgi:TetR/AcrR family transcriptional regulator, transcriptional repressor for nem operon
MVGVRRFDADAAVEQMVAVFWAKGFETTSLDDLVAATGVKRQSLYNAFGDKEAMFLAALEHYGRKVSAELLDGLTDDAPRRGLERVVSAHADGLARTDNPGGCLANNVCAELGGRAGRLGATVAEGVRSTELAVFSALGRWQAAGQIRNGDLRPLARFIVALLRGMATVHKATGDAHAAREAGEVGLAAVDPWMAKNRNPRSRAATTPLSEDERS